MIKKIDEIFNIITYSLDSKTTSRFNFDTELIITFHDSDFLYLNEWFHSVYNNDGSWIKLSDYKPELFISDKFDIHFMGCFIRSMKHDMNNNTCIVDINTDYHVIGGELSELIHIHRDKKINQILD
jgi:hypothetical protein